MQKHDRPLSERCRSQFASLKFTFVSKIPHNQSTSLHFVESVRNSQNTYCDQVNLFSDIKMIVYNIQSNEREHLNVVSCGRFQIINGRSI